MLERLASYLNKIWVHVEVLQGMQTVAEYHPRNPHRFLQQLRRPRNLHHRLYHDTRCLCPPQLDVVIGTRVDSVNTFAVACKSARVLAKCNFGLTEVHCNFDEVNCRFVVTKCNSEQDYNFEVTVNYNLMARYTVVLVVDCNFAEVHCNSEKDYNSGGSCSSVASYNSGESCSSVVDYNMVDLVNYSAAVEHNFGSAAHNFAERVNCSWVEAQESKIAAVHNNSAAVN